MGVMRGYTLRDKRGRELQANVADCVNVSRTPKARELILEGKFHRVDHPAGTSRVSVEKTFFYSDFGRKQFFLVLPRWDRHKWREATQDLRDMMAHLPEALAPSAQRTVRVVCGLAELREKLVAFDAELDDRMVEVLKAMLLHQHPFLLQWPRLNIVLNRVSPESVEFVVSYDHHPARYRVGYPRRVVDDLVAQGVNLEECIGLMKAATSVKDEDNPLWINLRRGSSSTWALAELDRWATQIELDPKVEIDIDSDDFGQMLESLPRGSELSAAAKRDLNVLRTWTEFRKRRGRREFLKEELWQIYFGKELKGEWSLIKPDLIERLWKVLDDLNDGDVEGNSFIDQFHLGTPGETSFYDPSTDDVGIDRAALPKGKAYDRGWFEQRVLHEVGHGVHAMHQKQVDDLLAKSFGWMRCSTTDAGITRWIKAMGGYPEEATTELHRRQIRSYIKQWVGSGERWTPPAGPKVPAGHPWHAKNFGPRLACELTATRDKTKRWYDNYADWHRVGRRRFFVNYWYGELMIVSDDALECVRSGALDPYALMAPPEFFAELYMALNAKEPSLVARRRLLDPDLAQFVGLLGSEQSSDRATPARHYGLLKPTYVSGRRSR